MPDCVGIGRKIRKELSFPEQNGKLLIAFRRYQSRVARLHRWRWFLKGEEKQQKIARTEISECDDTRWITAESKALVERRDPRGLAELESQLRQRLQAAPGFLKRVANRLLPLRGRSWHWKKHPASADKNCLHYLTQSGPSLDSKEHPVWLRGQRGRSASSARKIHQNSLLPIPRNPLPRMPPTPTSLLTWQDWRNSRESWRNKPAT